MKHLTWLALSLAIAACGMRTAPPTTGASSSAPSAVEQADHGNAGGGASKLTPASSETPARN